jgi:hypothetical protein
MGRVGFRRSCLARDLALTGSRRAEPADRVDESSAIQTRKTGGLSPSSPSPRQTVVCPHLSGVVRKNPFRAAITLGVGVFLPGSASMADVRARESPAS